MKHSATIRHHLSTGAAIHGNYVDALAEYLEQVRRYRKSSWLARQARMKIKGYLVVKSDSDNRFYRRHYRYEGPSPYYNHNPSFQERRSA
jgi:hypothetical protein